MKRFITAFIVGLVAYFLVGVASYFLVLWFPSNEYDGKLEASMTSVFFFGPIGALIAFIVSLLRNANSARHPDEDR